MNTKCEVSKMLKPVEEMDVDLEMFQDDDYLEEEKFTLDGKAVE